MWIFDYFIQSCKKCEMLHDPEICIKNFTRDFTPPLFPKITKWPSKAKNYHTTKKKGSANFYNTEHSSKSQNDPLKQKIIAQLKKIKKRFCKLSHHLKKGYTNTQKKKSPSKKFYTNSKIFT